MKDTPSFIHHSSFPFSYTLRRRVCSGSGRLNLEADVQRARRVRERADANQVNARLRVRAHVLKRDAARRFEQHARRERARNLDQAARLLRRLVVQEEYVSARLDGVAQVALARDLDLNLV